MSYVPTLPRSLSTQGVLGRALRRGLLNRRLHRIVGSRVQSTLVRLAYLGRFSQWVDEHALEPGFRSRLELYDHLVRSEGLEAGIDYLEFGVFQGASIRWWSERIADPAARFVGFDTFEGLPEAWAGEPAGGLTAGGRVPEVADTRVRFETGLFQDTLPRFLERTARTRRLVVNLDADLYSSTLFVLSSLAPRLKQHDLLVFDEMGSLREPAHEFRAFLDFAAAYRFAYRPIAASPVYKVVAIRLESDVVPRPAGLP